MAKTEKKFNQVNLLGVYEYLSRELQQARDVLMTEVRMASAQISSLHGDLKASGDKSSTAISQEIRFSYKQNQTIYDGLASMLTKEVAERLNSMEEMLSSLEKIQFILDDLNQLKYGYMNLQASCDTTQAIVANEVNPKLDSLGSVMTNEINAIQSKMQLLDDINNRLAAISLEDEYNRIIEAVSTKADDSSRQVVDAIAAIPTAENVDYTRIVEEVGDKVLDILQQMKGEEPAPVETKIDYDRIICGAAEKVVESLPAPEKIDYERIADMVAAKVVIPAVDYDRLAEVVIEKMSAVTEKACEVMLDEAGIDEIASKVADKITPADVIDYDKVCQAAQAAQILPDPVDYDRIAEIVEDKLNAEEPTYDLVIDEEGIAALAKGVSEELCQMCAPCECAPVEEVVEEIVEEAAPVEETVEEVVEEVVEEAPVEEVAPVEETASAEEEIAITATGFQEVGDDLIDAETGLVIRLKRSFTAKMKQSDEKIKGYYSDLKNELTSYKKVNSNVSWHGDRFNYGRDTVAKINICGKTLCFYLDLDPNDPELKSTIYHQKDVSGQKAYESTPFMVKVKSDAAAKKALRLVGYLAEKLGTEKDEGFEAVDYAGEFAYASTKQLFDEGFIKATKEKKVDLNF